MLLVTVPPGYAQWYTSQLVSQVIQASFQGDVQSTVEAIQKFKFIPWCFKGCVSEIARVYDTEKPSQILADTYREITGKEIEEQNGD